MCVVSHVYMCIYKLYMRVCVHVPTGNICSASLLLGPRAMELQQPHYWIWEPLTLLICVTTL